MGGDRLSGKKLYLKQRPEEPEKLVEIAKNKDLYYDALGQAQIGWHEGKEDAENHFPFNKVSLILLLTSCGFVY